jgi:hypothetical protein
VSPGPDVPDDVDMPGGNGFDAPSSNGFDAPDATSDGSARVEGNGHPAPITAGPGLAPALRGRWIVPLGIVSAATGVMMFLGVLAGGLVGLALGLGDPQAGIPAVLGLLAGAVAGIVIGSRVAIGMSGGGDDRLRPMVAGGLLGLVATVGLSALGAKSAFLLLYGAALLAPGIGAGIGDRVALARTMRDARR